MALCRKRLLWIVLLLTDFSCFLETSYPTKPELSCCHFFLQLCIKNGRYNTRDRKIDLFQTSWKACHLVRLITRIQNMYASRWCQMFCYEFSHNIEIRYTISSSFFLYFSELTGCPVENLRVFLGVDCRAAMALVNTILILTLFVITVAIGIWLKKRYDDLMLHSIKVNWVNSPKM